MGLTELIESHLDLNAAVAPSEVGHAKFLPCSFFFSLFVLILTLVLKNSETIKGNRK